ncbi:hypothetical protein F7725_023734 [Dissostichus mawsoni]|uniref:Reticulon n=1 Tax=Dissostichus mawsoni TaxID=36200 RepID=A0A7J5XY84_DISMA|nr:hypothetical protein F7725_023734 [Dissostichus mawsoni]
MADSEHVSSTTPLFSEESHHYEPETEVEPKQDLFSVDDIVDLVGGAQDALDRHVAEDSAPHESTEFSFTSEPEEPVTLTEPEPEVSEPESEPEPILPDSTSFSFVPDTPSLVAEEPEEVVVAPKVEPESTKTAPEPEAIPEPEPEPESDALPAAEPRKETQPPQKQQQQQKRNLHGDLLYWRDVKASGVVFGARCCSSSLTSCSIVSVCSYIGLALLSYLDQEVAFSEDMVHKYSDLVLAKINKGICELRRLFLFAVLMWILTYVGSLFNGLTILILSLVGLFSCPIVYEKHQAQIDHYLALVNNQVKDVVGKIQAKVPGMKRNSFFCVFSGNVEAGLFDDEMFVFCETLRNHKHILIF